MTLTIPTDSSDPIWAAESYEEQENQVVALSPELEARYRALLDHPRAFLSGAWVTFIHRALEIGVDHDGDDLMMRHLEHNHLLPLGL